MGDVIQGPSLLRTEYSILNRPNPSLLYYPGLRSLPFWSKYNPNTDETAIAYQEKTVTGIVKHLEKNYQIIKDEYNEVAPTLQSDYNNTTDDDGGNGNSKGDGDGTAHDNNTLHKGKWEWHSYMTKGVVQGHFGQYFPKTTAILQQIRGNQNEKFHFFEGVPFGYSFFSTLHQQSTIDAHNAPMNLRLRIHLPIIVPTTTTTSNDNKNNDNNNNNSSCGIRVGSTARQWKEGKALVFDDSYNHEVWNHTDETRVLFLLDIWHPDITMIEREKIIKMFDQQNGKGTAAAASSI